MQLTPCCCGLSPCRIPSEVLTVGSATMVEGFGVMVSSYPDYVDIRDRSKTFDGLVAFTSSTVGFATQPDAPPALRMGMLVSGNFFSVMGVEPQLGRAFRPEENQVPGRDAVLILGHDFWERSSAQIAPFLAEPCASTGSSSRSSASHRPSSLAWINSPGSSSTRPS